MPRGSGSTRVTANISQDLANNMHGMNTVGGRQTIQTQLAALDLRWHLNQGMSTEVLAVGDFDPAGKGGHFGFLYALRAASWDYTFGQHFSANGGYERRFGKINTNSAYDSRDPGKYKYSGAAYFLYDSYEHAYYFYNNGEIGSTTRYVSCIANDQGRALYYDYDGDRLSRIWGDTGQLLPYFGYNDYGNIETVHLQDLNGSDHRTTYYYYEPIDSPPTEGKLKAILEPEGAFTYFSIESEGSGWKIGRAHV